MNMTAARRFFTKKKKSALPPIEREEVEMPPQPQPRHRLSSISARGLLLLIVVGSLIFAALVGLVYVKYMVANTQLAINDLQTDIHKAENEKTRLQQRLDYAKNVEQIMDRAAALGMRKPTQDQILYVHLGDSVPAGDTAGE